MPRLFTLLLLTVWPTLSFAATTTVAVSTNFKTTLEHLRSVFEQSHPHQLKLVSASTGVLYKQIRFGAPFDLLLAADSQRPQLLEQQGQAINGSRFTYATGQLVLAGKALESRTPENITNPADIQKLLQANTGKLAIANPDTAPYGLASRQVLEHLGSWSLVQSQLVRAGNIAQAYQLVDSGNAMLGLVAYAQAIHTPRPYLKIPADWHQPIQQQAVLLQSGANNPATLEFIKFMQSPEASTIIRNDGYTVTERN
jgi:molybdate transport system substrate-binding protein